MEKVDLWDEFGEWSDDQEACPHCGNNDAESFESVRGFPGEHFVICSVCNEVVETEFNMWEVI